MIRCVDLHTHSTASDGQYRPAELVRLAQKAGVECLALTDHDTIDGLSEAVRAGEETGITVLRGIELGASEDRHLHIVGLGLREDCPEMQALCQKLKDSRDERKYRIAAFLEEKGVGIPLSEVEELAKGGVVARPHFAQVLLRHGFVSSTREAFDRYLDTSEYKRIERYKADAVSCISVIHASGGKAVLAHPCQLHYEPERLEELVRRLKEQAGLDALECYYPEHTPEMVRNYLDLAHRYDLHVSAGSDFHGEKVHADRPLCPVSVETDWLLAET